MKIESLDAVTAISFDASKRYFEHIFQEVALIALLHVAPYVGSTHKQVASVVRVGRHLFLHGGIKCFVVAEIVGDIALQSCDIINKVVFIPVRLVSRFARN